MEYNNNNIVIYVTVLCLALRVVQSII